MNEKLKVAAELSLPLDAVTQTMAAIARKGAGKTYLASMIAEQMLDARAQVIVVDPVDGDVPLVPEAGARITYPQKGCVRAADWLFVESSR